MGDWSAVYLRQALSTSASAAAGEYAAFSLAMTIGRLPSNMGDVGIVRLGGALVAIELGLTLHTERPMMAMLGFLCVRLGLSCAFPIAVSAAGRLQGMSAGAAVAAINTAGYTGFLAGPPLIGLVSEVTGLRGGLATLVLVGTLMLLLAPSLRGDEPMARRRRRYRMAAA